MPKHKIAPGVSKSIYPLEYNRNNPMAGYDQWANEIHGEVFYESMNKNPQYRIAKDTNALAKVLEAKAMNGLVQVANELLNQKK